MYRNPFMSAIFEREIGLARPNIGLFGCGGVDVPAVRLSQPREIVQVHGSENRPSEMVWLGGKQNILVTLNAYGVVFCYNLIDSSRNHLITRNHERAIKVFFAGDCLFMAVKTNSNDFVNFYLITIQSLQDRSATRNQILGKLSVGSQNIKEFDTKSFKIVTETRSAIEIWDIQSGQLYRSFPLHPHISYQYSNNFYVFWEQTKPETKIGIYSLLESKLIQFSLKTNKKIYFCRVTNNTLVLGIQNCNLQGIDLRTLKSTIVSERLPKTIIDFENTENFFTVFQDNSCMFNFESDKILKIRGNQVFVACELNDAVCFCTGNGELGRIQNGKVEICGFVNDVEQMGTNLDNGEIYLACGGKILIYE